MRPLLAASVLATTALLAGPIAGASAADNTFENAHCDVYGAATFDKPLMSSPGANTYHFLSNPKGSGPNSAKSTACSGKLNGITIKDVPVVAKVDGSGTLSCASSNAQGAQGWLQFRDAGNTYLGFTLDIVGFGTEVALMVHGQKSGSGHGEATFRDDPNASPPNAVATCGDKGFRELSFAAAFDGDSALVSPAPAVFVGGPGTPPPPSGGGGGAGTTQTSYTFRAIAQKLKAALKRGIGVSLRGNAPAKATLKAQLDKATAKRLGFGRKVVTVGRGTVQLTRAGSTTGFVKLTPAAKRKLKSARSVKVRIVGTIVDVTRRSTPVDKTVLLR
ncbi:MAG: hypothetical protein QOE65_2629 [Solirubrobacteraceae bacterium]|jgi:hypothetical protein|nr:hypothetical protein [Solirubrobacteraceae bacterium]